MNNALLPSAKEKTLKRREVETHEWLNSYPRSNNKCVGCMEHFLDFFMQKILDQNENLKKKILSV